MTSFNDVLFIVLLIGGLSIYAFMAYLAWKKRQGGRDYLPG